MIARSFLARCIAETPDNRYFGQENAAGEYVPHGGQAAAMAALAAGSGGNLFGLRGACQLNIGKYYGNY